MKPILSMIAIVLSVCPIAAGATNYTFTKLVDSLGDFAEFATPAMNNAGSVAFLAKGDDESSGIHVALPSGAIETVANDDEFAGFATILLQINDSNHVLFMEYDADHYDVNNSGLFKGYVGAPFDLVGQGGDEPLFVNFGFTASLNNSGQVVFDGRTTLDNESFVYLHNPNDSTIPLIDDTENFSRAVSPLMNNIGEVVFLGELDDGTVGIYLRSADGTMKEVGNGADPVAGLPLAFSDDGSVVYRTFDSGLRALYQASVGQPPILIADNSGVFDLFSTADINSVGTVAYTARFDGEAADGIFVGPDPVMDRLIGPGDSLFGGVVKAVFFRDALDNAGNIAFVYLLTNGETGIAIASVPEPSMAIVVVFLWIRKRRRA